MRLFIPVLFTVASLLQTSPLSDRNKQEQKPSKNRQATAEAPAKPVINERSNQDSPSNQERGPKRETQQRPEKPPWWDVAWWTIGLVIVGAGGVIAAIWTLRIIKRQTKAIESQVEEMRKALVVQMEVGAQTEKLVLQATQQSIAATKSADALINSERAWVNVGLRTLGGFYFELVATNFGRTPAKINQHYFRWEFPPSILDLPSAEQLYATKIDGIVTHTRLLAPNADNPWVFETVNLGALIGADSIRKLRAREMGLVLYGALRYTDLISDQPRETTFCYSYSVLNDDLMPVQDPAYRRYT